MNNNNFITKLCINTKAHGWIIGIVIVFDLFISDFLPKELKSGFEVIQLIAYIALIIWSIINLIVVNDARRIIGGTLHYLPRTTTIDELIERPNFNEYFKLFILLCIGQYSFDSFKIIGLLLYLAFAFFLIVISLLVIYRDYKKKRTYTTTILGNLFLVVCLLLCSKSTYSRIEGDEIIDSFFEKPEYRAKYYVNLFSETSKSKNYRLVADVHVYQETEEGYDDKSHTYKVISIERVYFNNGGYLYFDDCLAKIGEKTYCTDQNGKDWYIELTNIKPNNK